ncbi:hypothetical protein Q8W16_02905 [Photobacterium damselae subsp. piscicida]|nr:hypothetical protein [Photobacterium damselae subsp. piscicida]
MWPNITIEVSCGQSGLTNEVRFFSLGQRKHCALARLVFHDLKKAAFKKAVKSEINRLLTVILDDEDFLQDDKMRAIGSRFDRMYDRANLSAFDTEERNPTVGRASCGSWHLRSAQLRQLYGEP